MTHLQLALENLLHDKAVGALTVNRLKLTVEDLMSQLVRSSKRNEKMRHCLDATMSVVAGSEKEHLSRLLAGAENEAYRLQSELQNERQYRTGREIRSETIKDLLRRHIYTMNDWEAKVKKPWVNSARAFNHWRQRNKKFLDLYL